MGTEQVMGPDRPLAEGRWNGQHDLVLIAIVLLALGPRLVLSIVNTGANDPHMEVVSLILETNRLPHFDDCFQCYQPKLFHQITAAAVAAVGLEDPGRQRRLAQLLNFVAALGTVIVLWQMALQLPGGPGVRLLSFALVALNPRFNAITAQATNDSFVIFFGAVTIYSLWRFLEGASRWYCTSAVVSLILMSLAKTQGMVFFAMIVTILLAKILAARAEPIARRRLAGALLATILCFAATVPFLGPYYAHYQRNGDPFAANWERMPAPDWVEQSLHRRPGVRSIVDGYFTFRIVDMLRQPYVMERPCKLRTLAGKKIYDPRCSEHRTSFWSQLYGRAQFIQFAPYPDSWRTRDPLILELGRALILLGLVPLAILLYGLALEVRGLVVGMARHGPVWLARDNRWVLLAVLGGAILTVAQLEFLMRDFRSMKVIYTFPALVCFMAVFMRGFSDLTRRVAHRPRMLAGLYGIHALVLSLYVADICWLIGQQW